MMIEGKRKKIILREIEREWVRKIKERNAKKSDVEREGDYGHFCGSAPVFEHKFLWALKFK